MNFHTQLDTYTNTYTTPGADTVTDITMHPFYQEADAIAQEYQVSHKIVFHAMIAAFIGAYQHWITVGHPLDLEKKVKIIQYLITLAGSGEKKSLITDLLFEPIREHQQKLRDSNQQAPSLDKQLKAIWKVKKDVISSDLKTAYKNGCDDTSELELRLKEHIAQEPKPVVPTQLLLEGATVASLKRSLASSTIHPMVCTSEAIAFLKGQDEPSVAMLNRAWDGLPMVFETFRGQVDIPDPRLSMSLLTQTALFIKTVVANALMGDSGLWARCLISVATPYYPIYGPHHQPEDGRIVVQRIHERLRAQLENPITRHLTLSTTADMKWKYIFNCIQCNKTIPNTKESFTPAFAAKMPEHILRLATVIHLMYEKGDIIDVASIDIATSLVKEFHETQLRLFTSYYCPPQIYSDAWQLYDWFLNKRSGYPFTSMHTIQKYGPVSSRDLDSLKEQLKILEADKMIYIEKNKKSTEIYVSRHITGISYGYR